jgi:UDP-glucuronate 4-epimerase
MNGKTILVTGGAGFIGSNLCDALLKRECKVINIDNFNDFYDPLIKRRNIKDSLVNENYKLYVGDILDRILLEKVFNENEIDYVVHLAALAGVRTSLLSPLDYVDVDITGTVNLLETVRNFPIKKLIFGSSSSVYGLNKRVPFVENSDLDLQISPYAVAKRAAELYCVSYNYLYGIPVGVLRFFTVYGPRQRPEMAIHKFTRLIISGDKVPIFGDGASKRDYTYVTDIVDGIIKAIITDYNFEIFNLGSGHLIELLDLVSIISEKLGKKADVKFLPEQKGDVPLTFADISKAKTILGYNPSMNIEEGIDKFVDWYFEENKRG